MVYKLKTVFVVLTLCLTACASVPRDDALRLADTGNQAASAIQSQLARVAITTQRQTAVQAFNDTIERCQAAAGTCEPWIPNAELIAERSNIGQLIDLRIQVLGQLNAAYDAMRQEALYDARGDLGSAVKGLTQTVNAYAAVAGAGALPVTGAIDAFGAQAAGLFAQNKQNQRLDAANEIIGEAAGLMSEALSAESTVYVQFLDEWALREDKMHRLMLDNGLASRAQILAPLTDAVGIPMVESADAAIARNRSLRTAVDALVILRKDNRRNASVAAYAAAAQALENLSIAHAQFANLETPDFEKVMIVLAELNIAADSLNVLQ